MKPGERIRLIKEAASSMAVRVYADVQLILGEFGIETFDFTDSFSGDLDQLTYCTQRLQTATDGTLVAIHEFLSGEDAAPSDSSVDAFSLWGSEPGRAFLSHIHENRIFVGNVKTSLSHYGISGFVAHADINPSKQWRAAILEAIRSCHLFVAFLDEGFHESQWCDQEVGFAIACEAPILPVRPPGFDRDSLRHDGFIEQHQDVYLDDARHPDYAWLAEQVLNSLLTHSRTQDVGVKALVESFVYSDSYDETRRLWRLIEQQPLIESAQLRRLEYAVQTNRQVYEATSKPFRGKIPELVANLVKRFEPPTTYGYDDEPF
jgi:TIR domain